MARITSISLVPRSSLLSLSKGRASRKTATARDRARGHPPPSRGRALRDGRAKTAASSEREKEWNLGWQGRMTFRDRSPGGNFDSRLPPFGVEYSTFWGLSTPSGDSFTRSQDEVRGLNSIVRCDWFHWNQFTSRDSRRAGRRARQAPRHDRAPDFPPSRCRASRWPG